MRHTFIDLFSGIGGMRLGFASNGFECLFSSEINKYCRDTYVMNYGEIPVGDIANINPKSIPNHDVLTAGFPCQPFSICGKRKGFSDTRGTMFFHICNIISQKRPHIVLLENVKHILHHDKGKTIQIILESLKELGYNPSLSLENALNYGVPQNRERVIIVASKKDKFDFSLINHANSNKIIEDILEKENKSMEYLKKKDYTLIDNPVIQPKSNLIFAGYRNKSLRKKGVRLNTEHLSRVHKQPNRIYSIKGSHPTIPSQESSGRFFIHLPNINKVRKLTIRECYRLMGFPDIFKIHPSISEAYKQIGNSICVPMVNEIAKQIESQILGEYRKDAKSRKKSSFNTERMLQKKRRPQAST